MWDSVRSSLRATGCVACIVSTLSAFSAEPPAAAHPVVPGHERLLADPAKKPSLVDDEDDAPKPDPQAVRLSSGYLLLGELNCTSCHRPSNELKAALLTKQAPLLDAVGARVTVEFLRAFLANPHGVKPGTTMPALFAGHSDADRAKQVEPLVHYLAATGGLRHTTPDQTSAKRGEDTFHKVGCVACHGSQRENAKPFATAVPLGGVATKYSIASLTEFLRDPFRVRPSGRMPHLNLEEKDARDLANYLLKGIHVEPNLKFAYFEGNYPTVPDFSKIAPKSTGTVAGFDLGVAPRKNDFGMRFEGFLHIPREGDYQFHLGSDDGSRLTIDGNPVALNDGVHPFGWKDGRAKLAAGPHPIVVEYTQGGGEWELSVEFEGAGVSRQGVAGHVTLTKDPPAPASGEKSAAFAFDPELAKQGKELFAKAGCAACHAMKDGNKPLASLVEAKPIAELMPGAGCLAESVPANLPNYRLSPSQREALNAALGVKEHKPLDPKETIARTLAAFNCQACHEREKLGGPAVAVDDLFQGTIKEMGDEGRIPPHLNGIGDKLSASYLNTVLNNGAKDRPYMLTRMPRFGGGNVGHLTAAFEKADLKTESVVELPDEPIFRVKSTGRILVGENAFSCVKCHNFNPHKSTGIQSIDLTTMTARLRQDWFLRYMINPQKYRPGTRMPTAFPNGVSIVPKTYGGKPSQQLAAVWAYLEDGTKAAVPSGIVPEAIELKPEREPILYRNFLETLSPRGIAVGLPEKVHYAFDADNVCLALIWHGQFIDASKHWVGRGPGNQTPLGDHVLSLVRGAPLAVLPSGDAGWPATPPKEQGWKFAGYRLDAARRPVFRYALSGLAIEDVLAPVAGQYDPGLERRVSIAAEKPVESLWYRAAAGKTIEPQSDGGYLVNGVLTIRVKANGATPVVRKQGDQFELLVPVTLQGNRAEIVQTYHW